MRAILLFKAARRFAAAMLAMMIITQGAAGLVHAEETVTSIQLDAVASPIQMYVDDGTVSLVLWANIQGSAISRNITAEAVWTSSSSAVKVDKGVISATDSASSATITAKYKTFTASATVKADYRYAGLKLLTANNSEAPDQFDIELGNTLIFNATAYEYNGDPVAATSSAQWLTSNSNVAAVSGGAVTLVNPGTVTITAKLKGRADSIVLTVTSPYQSLDISHSPGVEPVEMLVGDADYNLKAIATLKNASAPGPDITSDASWTTSNASVVKVDKGVVTAVGAGTAVVSAKRYGAADAVTFYVRTPYEALKLTTSKTLNMTLYGAQVEVSAAGLKGSEDALDVSLDAIWTLADPMVAAIEKSNGRVFVKPKGVGNTRLTVSYKGLSKDLPVQVYPSINILKISKDRLDVFEGESGEFPSIKGISVAGNEIDVSKLVDWNSSDGSILTLEDGKWTAQKTGTVTLTAEVENEPDKPKKSDSIDIVIHKKVLKLAADAASVSVVIGKELDLPKVGLMYTDGEEKDVSADVIWKSSSDNLLLIPGKMKGLLASYVTLTGTYLNKSVTVKVQVEEEFTSIEIVPKTLNLTLNKLLTVKVTGTTGSGKTVSIGSRVTWTTSSANLVQIKGASIKGTAEGSGTLTASIQGKSYELKFTVKSKLLKLTSSVTSLNMGPGATANVKLSAAYENRTKTDATKNAVWTSSNEFVATVKDGEIKALAKGTASIKAVYEGKPLTVRVTVK